ncbi:hypothetical protein GCM10008023_39530 [Sphingomonas glacialis]|uniref:DUF2726 domain-containing protein n=2 Tax=Sphingomonas glacialis TaxID=658225 RepID=A0ABQ3LTX7_9SPHN|nr:hypothetical protein GCM10008023_39530 [Sphingomonas glacialis]
MNVFHFPPICYVVFAFLFVLAAIGQALAHIPRVRAKPLLTECERATRAIIERVLPHARVHVQVSMGALIQAKGGFGRGDAMRTCKKFSQKIVDFVIEDLVSGAILALVELDDRSHEILRDRLRDKITASAGYRTIHLPAGRVGHANIAARLKFLKPKIATAANVTLSGASRGA